MSTLDNAATMRFDDYNPSHIIDAVNALQPLGKQQSLATLRSYVAGRSGNDTLGLFWVLRVLFEVPAGQVYPPVRLGQPDVSPPASPELLPQFPVVVIRDVPLLMVRSYLLGGFPDSVAAHLTYFETYGTIRSVPLVPPRSKEGLTDELARLWKTSYGSVPPAVLELAGAQIARMQ